MIMHKNQYKFLERLGRKIQKTTGNVIQIKHGGGNKQLSMEGIAVGYFKNSIDPGINGKNIF